MYMTVMLILTPDLPVIIFIGRIELLVYPNSLLYVLVDYFGDVIDCECV